VTYELAHARRTERERQGRRRERTGLTGKQGPREPDRRRDEDGTQRHRMCDPPARPRGGARQRRHEQRALLARPGTERHAGAEPTREAERADEDGTRRGTSARDRRGGDDHERPVGQVREEAHAETDAVQEGRRSEREEGPPPIGHLTPHLRHRHAETEHLLGQVERGERGYEREPCTTPRRAQRGSG
jgi:hypothetical protein